MHSHRLLHVALTHSRCHLPSAISCILHILETIGTKDGNESTRLLLPLLNINPAGEHKPRYHRSICAFRVCLLLFLSRKIFGTAPQPRRWRSGTLVKRCDALHPTSSVRTVPHIVPLPISSVTTLLQRLRHICTAYLLPHTIAAASLTSHRVPSPHQFKVLFLQQSKAFSYLRQVSAVFGHLLFVHEKLTSHCLHLALFGLEILSVHGQLLGHLRARLPCKNIF
jgi:hypothetical protein